MCTLHVSETFSSIQGESTYAGLSCFFIRLVGCNLRCGYCDTAHALEGGTQRPVAELVAEAQRANSAIIEITGGEPLLQDGCGALAEALLVTVQRPVLIETNGTQDIGRIPHGAVAIIDIKTPGSGEGDSFDEANLQRLRAHDELKFVLCDRDDYEWARQFLKKHDLEHRACPLLFSPAVGRLAATDLAEWIVADGLCVRLQLQLHKILGVR